MILLSYQSIDEIVQSGKSIQQALCEFIHSITKEKYDVLLHAPYDTKYHMVSVPITAHGFRYGTLQYIASSSDSQESMQVIAVLCSNYLVYVEQSDKTRWYVTTNLYVSPDITASERSVLTAMYEEYGTKDIARILSLTPYSVRTYRSRLYAKFQVSSVLSLVRRASDMGFFRYLG